MINDLKKINKIIDSYARRHLIYLSIFKFFSGILEMLSVASVAPFIAVISSDKFLKKNNILLNIKSTFNFNDTEIIILLAIISLLLISSSNIFKVFTVWYESRVSHNLWLSLTVKLYDYYLNKPYLFHIQNSSNELLEKISVRTNAAIAGVITPFFQILGNTFSFVFILFLLFYVDPLVTLFLVIFTSIFYIFFFSRIKEQLSNYGKYSPEYSKKTFKLVDQSFKSIKDVKINSNANYYIKSYYNYAKQFINNSIKIDFFLSFPKSAIEIFAYTFGFSLTILFLTSQSYEFSKIAIILGLYALGLQKMMPSLQSIYQQISLYRFYKPSLNIIYSDLFHAVQENVTGQKHLKNKNIFFNYKINFEKIKFKYPDNENFLLKIENLEIKKGNFVGITGKSGSGKSTFINILTGLLDVTSGDIKLDDNIITQEMIRKWQSIIGYVAQNAFVANDTIKNNIALGIPSEQINMSKIVKFSKLANISEFIENDLELKYDTFIGEDAIKLSGGQRQRICIARALYNEPQILILDEATNSLDVTNEREIINSLLKLKKNMTIFMITHRMSTLRYCDEVLLFDEGCIDDRGRYDKLIRTNSNFKKMEEEISKEGFNEGK